MVKAIKATKFRPVPLFAVILTMAAMLAAVVDEVTSILFVAAIVLEVCAILRINPIPMLILTIMTTNIGSATTVLGNPIGIYIALRAALTFEDFIRWSAPVVMISLIVTILIGLLWFRKEVAVAKKNAPMIIDKDGANLDEWEDVKDKSKFNRAIILFIVTIGIIIAHKQIESLLFLEINTVLIGAPWIGAGLLLLFERREARDYVEKGVDWWTLSFFLFLFGAAGSLEYTGVAYKIAYAIESAVGGAEPTIYTTILVFLILLWLAAILSGFIDNLPAIAALLPVATAFIGLGLPHAYVLWWALLLGGCFGGNLTMVGSTANIVALGLLEKRRDIIMRLRWWLPIGMVIVIVTVALASVILIAQISLMPR